MYLIFDTETTGVPRDWKRPHTDTKNWPRMVQLSWLVFNKNFEETDRQDYIIFPEKYTIPAGAAKVHGITTERAKSEGQDLEMVLNHFAKAINDAEHLIGHNISFDENIAGAEFVRKSVANQLFEKPRFCTMKETVDYCKLPGRYGYKWPTLAELHFKIFGEGFDNAHNAMADSEATARCFFKLLAMEEIYI